MLGTLAVVQNIPVKQLVSFIAKSVLSGLGLALVIMLSVPSLRPALNNLTSTANQQNTSESHLTFAKAVRRAAPSVVTIYAMGYSDRPRFAQTNEQQVKELGSGVIMTSKGHILTNYHVIDRALQIRVLLADGRQYQAELLGSDALSDLALLKIDGDDFPAIPQDKQFEPQVGDVVLAIGNPLNLGQTITQGIISAVGKKGLTPSDHTSLLQMDAAINVGNSGGALVNSNGILVGINTASFKSRLNTDIQGIFFAIPYDLATRVMDKLMRFGQFRRGWLGVSGTEVDQSGAQVIGNSSKVHGFKITGLDPFGPAWQAGMLENDVLLAIDGKAILSGQQALDIVADAEIGSIVKCTVERAGQTVELSVLIKEFPINQS